MGSTSLSIKFEDVAIRDHSKSPRNYFLLASGPSNTEIPHVRIPRSQSRVGMVNYVIRDAEMAKLFAVEPQTGAFRVAASQLSREQSPFKNGTFHVPVDLVDIFDANTVYERANVVVQLSEMLTDVQCPRIVESAMCRFTINPTTFDPSEKEASKEVCRITILN